MKVGIRAVVVLVCLAVASAGHAMVLECGTGGIANGPLDPSKPATKGEKENPDIHWPHIFCGDVNAATGKSTGFHSRPGGNDPVYASGTKMGQVYATAEVDPHTAEVIYIGRDVKVEGAPKKGAGSSTFFPDQCTQAQVEASVGYAYKNGTVVKPGTVEGHSAPAAGDATYCLKDKAAEPFTVRLHPRQVDSKWQVDSAYPIK